MINRGTSDGVQNENFSPRRSATVCRVDLDFCKRFVEACESVGLFLEEPPKPVLEHCVSGFAVAGKPQVTHCTMQVLLVVGEMFPFNNRQHDNPREGGGELLKNPVTKEQKVPDVFDIDLADCCNSDHRCDFTQLGAECGGYGKSCCAKVSSIEGCVTCLVPRMEAPPDAAAPAALFASVSWSSSASW